MLKSLLLLLLLGGCFRLFEVAPLTDEPDSRGVLLDADSRWNAESGEHIRKDSGVDVDTADISTDSRDVDADFESVDSWDADLGSVDDPELVITDTDIISPLDADIYALDADRDIDIEVPEVIPLLVAGDHRTCLLFPDGVLRCWGSNSSGSLGLGIAENIGDDEPASAGGPAAFGGVVTKVGAGDSHVCVVQPGAGHAAWAGRFFRDLKQRAIDGRRNANSVTEIADPTVEERYLR